MNRHFPNRSIICIDMKSFYASCIAMLEGIDVMKVPIAVIANFEQPGSVVLAASPPMKEKYNIKTGNRKYEIPNHADIQLFKPKMAFFINLSVEITKLIADFVPRSAMHIYSIDEIFIDLTATKKLWGNPVKTARAIQQAIYNQFRILSSVGLGPNMLMAKLALDLAAKKTGFAEWTYADVKTKLWKVSPLSKMWGIGKGLERQLNQIGIQTVGELANTDLAMLEKKFGVIGNQLYYHAWGIDLSDLGEPEINKHISFGKSQILLRDYHQKREIEIVILEMCEDIAKRARDNGYVARTVSLGLSYSKQTRIKGFQRSKTVQIPTNDTREIYLLCKDLLTKHFIHMPVRQLSVRISNMERSESIQLDLFDTHHVKQFTLARTIDQLRDRFGPTIILRAVSYTKAGTAIRRNELVGGHFA